MVRKCPRTPSATSSRTARTAPTSTTAAPRSCVAAVDASARLPLFSARGAPPRRGRGPQHADLFSCLFKDGQLRCWLLRAVEQPVLDGLGHVIGPDALR